VASGRAAAQLAGPVEEAVALAFSPDGRLLATADAAGELRVWEWAGRGLLTTYQDDKGKPRPGERLLAFSPDGRSVVTLAGGAVVVVDAQTGTAERQGQALDWTSRAACPPEGRGVALARLVPLEARQAALALYDYAARTE